MQEVTLDVIMAGIFGIEGEPVPGTAGVPAAPGRPPARLGVDPPGSQLGE